MAFTKGTPKPEGSGRKKGTPNKLSATVRERLEELGCDPIEGMAQIAMDKSNTPELRHKAYADIAQYAYPKLKAIEHSGPGGKDLFTIDAVRAFMTGDDGPDE